MRSCPFYKTNVPFVKFIEPPCGLSCLYQPHHSSTFLEHVVLSNNHQVWAEEIFGLFSPSRWKRCSCFDGSELTHDGYCRRSWLEKYTSRYIHRRIESQTSQLATKEDLLKIASIKNISNSDDANVQKKRTEISSGGSAALKGFLQCCQTNRAVLGRMKSSDI